MQEIEKIRSEIDQIHRELVRLFRQRLLLSQKIWEIKRSNNLPLIDSDRESLIIHSFDESISQIEEKQAVQGFLKSLLSESRKFLQGRFR